MIRRGKGLSPLATNLALLGISLGMALLLVAVVEGGLRLAGIGERNESRLAYQRVYPPVMEPADRYLRTADRRLPHQVILAEKPSDALRVVVFGASATAGLGFGPNVTFARELERMLVAAYPDRSVEVLNLGIVAVPSSAVERLVEDACRHYEPDALVVYAGNNEFMEIHSAKYSEFQATAATRLRDWLLGLHIARVLNDAILGGQRGPSLAEQAAAQAGVRAAERTIIRDIEISDAEIDEILDAYERNLEGMVEVARESGKNLLIATVASNWRWRGREDLPPSWLDELLGEPGDPTPERYRAAIAAATEQLESAPRNERHALLYRRATAAEALGDLEAARADFRAALNADPHLRRALDAGNERVRAVAMRSGVPVVDVVQRLSEQAAGGIIGFDEFYDNVHFTPRGAVSVAAIVFDALLSAGFLPPAPDFDASAFAAERIALVEQRSEDPFELTEWMGFGFDPAQIAERDPWKYDRLLHELDERIAAHPEDVAALVYRGNIHYFKLGGAKQAEQDYRAALELSGGDPRIEANLERLLAEQRR